jgi:hypothetical protein
VQIKANFWKDAINKKKKLKTRIGRAVDLQTNQITFLPMNFVAKLNKLNSAKLE